MCVHVGVPEKGREWGCCFQRDWSRQWPYWDPSRQVHPLPHRLREDAKPCSSASPACCPGLLASKRLKPRSDQRCCRGAMGHSERLWPMPSKAAKHRTARSRAVLIWRAAGLLPRRSRLIASTDSAEPDAPARVSALDNYAGEGRQDRTAGAPIGGAMCAPLTPRLALAEIKISGARMALPGQ